ncbi:stress responsive protein [Pseudomonas daroniae]|uniref:Stress responsive protein n=1 Tax=Phytopseudomonas daroniae TaxID=2487519 RepID=A0A4Q9QPA1_9GAMM|nr:MULTISPECIES: Dabb family protein [Pseudomonas]TBU74651.1 stress responsive protein [Pseudomonas daroniae]TBU82038.1 stress responsive protein [Pseudomonas daroniae]TBU84626.1 stress responsive protein [Pseudomonas sp. FRB 228]TBU92339.1 stress responsive protein [Pseudomonas daroniae]
MQPVKHIVMWNLSGDTEQERTTNIQKLKNAFEEIRSEIPGLRLLEIGVDFSKVDYACDVVLYSEFDSVEALEGYASHPAHLRVREELGTVRIARHQVDYLY